MFHFALFRRSLTATAQNRDFCTNSKRKILISPASYLRFINTLSSMHADSNTKLEDRKSRLEKLIQKVQGIETQVTRNTVKRAGKQKQSFLFISQLQFVVQVTELRQDLKDVEPKIEAIGESTVKKRDKIKELGETKSKMSDDFGYQDEQLKELRTEVEELKARTDSELNQLREDMQGVKKFIFL